MIQRLKIEAGGLAPLTHFDVVFFILPLGHGFVGNIGNTHLQLTNLRLQFVQLLFTFGEFGTKAFHFCKNCRCVFPFCFCNADFFGFALALCLQVFGFHLQGFTAFFKLLNGTDIQFIAANFQFGGHFVQFIAQ